MSDADGAFCVACQGWTETRPCAACGAEPWVGGRYRLLGLIGAGARATTWRAAGPRGEVALKELALRRVRTPKDRELVDREMRVLAELDLEGVPRLHEVVETGRGRSRTLWLVQDLVPGRPLHRAWDGPVSEPEVLGVIADAATLLARLHALRPPVIHRDVKPANLILGPDGTLSLVDFGSVRDAVREPGGGSTVAGTFGYLAPEQLLGDAGPASDLYGLGATAVHLLTGEPPHRLLDVGGSLRWRDAVRVRAGTGRLLDALLEPDPERRLADASEAARTATWLRQALGRPRSPGPRTPRAGRGTTETRSVPRPSAAAEPTLASRDDDLPAPPLPEATSLDPRRGSASAGGSQERRAPWTWAALTWLAVILVGLVVVAAAVPAYLTWKSLEVRTAPSTAPPAPVATRPAPPGGPSPVAHDVPAESFGPAAAGAWALVQRQAHEALTTCTRSRAPLWVTGQAPASWTPAGEGSAAERCLALALSAADVPVPPAVDGQRLALFPDLSVVDYAPAPPAVQVWEGASWTWVAPTTGEIADPRVIRP